jgi:fido (protein-threonine AMPylation protein)
MSLAPEPPLPPFLFPARSPRERRWLARLRADGRIRKIGPRLYTSLPEDRVAAAVRQSWSTIVSALFPGVLVSHRTAFEYVPSPEGVVFVTSTTNRTVSYPGLDVEFIRGPGPLPDDPRFLELHASSLARTFLENLSHDPRRARPRTVPIERVEQRLEQILRDGGEAELVALRDRAREIARELGWRAEMTRLDALVGALLGTRPAGHLVSATARARAAGEPFDPACLERLQLLFGELRTRSLPRRRDTFEGARHAQNKAFFEAYFSNYIEGTRFDVEDAEEIVFERKIPAGRPVDAHDILGTFEIVSDPTEMRRTPASFAGLLELLRTRHRRMLERRPEVAPGTFKEKPNRAGDTEFVAPASVIGTLRKGHELYDGLPAGLPRAIFVMFLVADVHPFNDGNGRIARVMMNAELAAAGAPTIIIPTVFRDDYLQALRKLTRRHRPDSIVDALVKAAAFSHLDFADYPRVLAELRRRNWFRDPDDARIDASPTIAS